MSQAQITEKYCAFHDLAREIMEISRTVAIDYVGAINWAYSRNAYQLPTQVEYERISIEAGFFPYQTVNKYFMVHPDLIPMIMAYGFARSFGRQAS